MLKFIQRQNNSMDMHLYRQFIASYQKDNIFSFQHLQQKKCQKNQIFSQNLTEKQFYVNKKANQSEFPSHFVSQAQFQPGQQAITIPIFDNQIQISKSTLNSSSNVNNIKNTSIKPISTSSRFNFQDQKQQLQPNFNHKKIENNQIQCKIKVEVEKKIQKQTLKLALRSANVQNYNVSSNKKLQKKISQNFLKKQGRIGKNK